ncbi:MAG: mandelate racemase/muconate lactonizing enzyme family protein [Caldilineaceae bacterium]
MAIQNNLTFTKFRVYEVVVPARADILSAPSKGAVYVGTTSWPDMPIHLIEGVTSQGFTALGECGRGTSRAVVENTLRDLLGRNLLEKTPATLWMGSGDLPQSYPFFSWTLAGQRSYQLMESLWLDAVGKASGLPVHQLLGGAVRNEVLTAFWANRPPAATLRALIHEAVEKGLNGIKIKSDSTCDTAKAIVEIAADIPADFRVTIDPMSSWRSLRESVRWIEKLAALPFNIILEDPFPALAVEDWREARNFNPLTIVLHARDESELRKGLRDEMADAYNLAGSGAYDFLRTTVVAESFAKDCWHGSALELGVYQHVRLHAAACARNCVLASDLQSEWVREHTLVTPRMEYHGTYAVVPNRPGLGVELDHAAVKKYLRSEFEVQ